MEDLKHQLVSPLRTATERTDIILRSGRFETRTESQIKAVRGLCRKASRVALSAGVFAALSKGERPVARAELLGCDDLLRLLIGEADDAQMLSNPRLAITFDVDRESIRALGRRLVLADPSLLQQCVGNLLDNASKYSYRGTRVRVSGLVHGRELSVAVENRGLRLEAEDVANCLSRNWRGDLARNATGEGSGIGLWIVDNLMRAMGGRVHVATEDDVSTFSLALPLA
jgi:signal transduction histidine kinase